MVHRFAPTLFFFWQESGIVMIETREDLWFYQGWWGLDVHNLGVSIVSIVSTWFWSPRHFTGHVYGYPANLIGVITCTTWRCLFGSQFRWLDSMYNSPTRRCSRWCSFTIVDNQLNWWRMEFWTWCILLQHSSYEFLREVPQRGGLDFSIEI
jgi:hypothetical protein